MRGKLKFRPPTSALSWLKTGATAAPLTDSRVVAGRWNVTVPEVLPFDAAKWAEVCERMEVCGLEVAVERVELDENCVTEGEGDHSLGAVKLADRVRGEDLHRVVSVERSSVDGHGGCSFPGRLGDARRPGWVTSGGTVG